MSEDDNRMAELEGMIARMSTTMRAAAAEIEAHWEAHCDEEGYGPRMLVERLKGDELKLGYACYPCYCEWLNKAENERDRYKNMLKDLLAEIVIVFDDERLDYVDAQISKAALKAARAAVEVRP